MTHRRRSSTWSPPAWFSAANGAIDSFTTCSPRTTLREACEPERSPRGWCAPSASPHAWVPTTRTPLGDTDATLPYSARTPDDVASIVLFLASREARVITGATIPAGGGLTAHGTTDP